MENKSILQLLLKLVASPSVTGEPGAENSFVDMLYSEISSWQYFQDNPANLWRERIEGDLQGRVNLCALVTAKKETKKTILLISHHDVVQTDVCGDLKELAFDPLKYTEAMRELELPDDARADLESGEWLYGRGVSDMKGGMAVQLTLLHKMSQARENMDANVLLMTLADEENNGFGVHQAARMLARMQSESGYQFIGCIDSEPTITNADKNAGRIYLGSIGNATLFAMCVGVESHVGEYFLGVNASLIASYLVKAVEGDPASSDGWMGERYSPATCLRIKDMGKGYTVTLPERVAVLFNQLMVTFSPGHLLDYFNGKVRQALSDTLEQLYARREELRSGGYNGMPVHRHDFRIITFAELERIVAERTGQDVKALQKKFLNTLDSGMDSQDRGVELVNHMLDLSELKGPFAVTGFLSPYCQPRINYRRTAGERRMLAAADSVIAYAGEQYGITVIRDEVYEGISDMSEMGYQGSENELNSLKNNLIGYGIDLMHPFDAMKALDIPVINLGPIGKDAHKLTERVNLPYLTGVLPDLMAKLIKEISRG